MIIPIRVSCRHYYNHVNIFGSSHCSAHTFNVLDEENRDPSRD